VNHRYAASDDPSESKAAFCQFMRWPLLATCPMKLPQEGQRHDVSQDPYCPVAGNSSTEVSLLGIRQLL
jgi:hypothetical protein